MTDGCRCLPTQGVVPGTEGDPGADAAVALVRKELVEPDSRLRLVTLKDMVAAARRIDGDLAAWADRFERRYLAVDAPDRGTEPDPQGPRLGTPLAAPTRRTKHRP